MVLDASSVLAWLVERSDPDEARLADRLLHLVEAEEACVPALWYLEVANGLLVAEARNAMDRQTVDRFWGELAALPITEDDLRPESLLPNVIALSRKHGLTAYDASYLELALRLGATLATFDRKLAEAARAAGVAVVGAAWA